MIPAHILSRWLLTEPIYFLYRNNACSNKDYIAPSSPKMEPENLHGIPAYNGYPFRLFLGNVLEHLSERLSMIEGMQQLIHTYYLNNGYIGAVQTANRIKHLLKDK